MLVLAEVGQEVLDGALGMALEGAEPAQRRVDGDAVQPGPELGPSLEAADVLEGRRERLLDGVAGVLLVAQDAPGHEQHAAAVGAEAGLEGVVIAGPHAGQQGLIVQGRPGRAAWGHVVHTRAV